MPDRESLIAELRASPDRWAADLARIDSITNQPGVRVSVGRPVTLIRRRDATGLLIRGPIGAKHWESAGRIIATLVDAPRPTNDDYRALFLNWCAAHLPSHIETQKALGLAEFRLMCAAAVGVLSHDTGTRKSSNAREVSEPDDFLTPGDAIAMVKLRDEGKGYYLYDKLVKHLDPDDVKKIGKKRCVRRSTWKDLVQIIKTKSTSATSDASGIDPTIAEINQRKAQVRTERNGTRPFRFDSDDHR